MSVLVFAENWDGNFKKLSFELVSYAAKVAEMTGTTATALSIGQVSDDELKKLGNYGAKKIISLKSDLLKNLDSQAYTAAIAEIAQNEGAKIIVLANNNMGKSIAPRLSVRLKAAIGSGTNKLPQSIDPFVVYRKVYSGNAFAHVKLNSEIKILTLMQDRKSVV